MHIYIEFQLNTKEALTGIWTHAAGMLHVLQKDDDYYNLNHTSFAEVKWNLEFRIHLQCNLGTEKRRKY